MQIGRKEKSIVEKEHLKKLLMENQLYVGENPYKEGQVIFNGDQTFCQNGQLGRWDLAETEGRWLLEMKWNDGDSAKFKITKVQAKNNVMKLECVEAGDESKQTWKIASLPKGCKLARMTLKSHPDQALVPMAKEEKVIFKGVEVKYFGIGPKENACLFLIDTGALGGQGEIIRLTDEDNHCMDVCEAKF